MMKQFYRLVIVLTFSLFVFSSIGYSADAKQAVTKPVKVAVASVAPTSRPDIASVVPSAPKIDAKAYVLIDADSGAILASDNMDTRRAPASLTKLMALYIISSSLDQGTIHLDDKVRISKTAWKTGGSKMFVKVGDMVTVKDLLQGMIVDSGNDATVAMAEYIAGSQDAFVQMMNSAAGSLGMTNTHFTDVNGLPSADHYSTAHDLGILARAIIEDFPQDYSWYSQKTFTYANIKQNNRNTLLWHNKYVDGLKTGHTNAAGFCLVASAKKDGMRLISVVLGASSESGRAEDSDRLLTYGFRFYQTQMLFAPDKKVANTRVYSGDDKYLDLGFMHALYVTYPSSQKDKLKTDVKINKLIKAPVKKGQQLGTYTVTLDGKTISNTPLVALNNDPVGGWWRRFVDWMILLVSGWF